MFQKALSCCKSFYCLNFFHSLATENKRESQKKLLEQDICNVVMPSEDTKILEFTQNPNFDKALSIIYADC